VLNTTGEELKQGPRKLQYVVTTIALHELSGSAGVLKKCCYVCVSWRHKLWLHSLLIPALDGNQWSVSMPGRLLLGNRDPFPLYTRLIGPQVWY